MVPVSNICIFAIYRINCRGAKMRQFIYFWLLNRNKIKNATSSNNYEQTWRTSTQFCVPDSFNLENNFMEK
jgi:hypothetical protein